MRFSSRSSALFRAVYILASISSASTAAIPTNATVSAQGSVVTDAAGVRYLAPGLKVPLSSANVLRRDDKRDVNSNQQIANGDGNVQINNQVINGGAVSALTSLPGSCVLRSRVITVTATNGVVIDDPTYAVSAIPTTITTTNSLGALVTITTTIDPAQSSSSGAAQYLATSTGPSTFSTLTATNTSITTTTATSVLGSSSSDPAAATSAAATSGTSTVPTSSTTTSTAAAATSTCPTAEADGTEVDLSSVSYPMVDQAAFVQAMLEQHNAYRQRNQVGAVTWNSTLAAAALVRSSSGVFEHTANNPYGENLAMGGYSNPLYYGFLWYNESLQYDYSNPGFSEATGHFTQMVWEGSLEIGCAYVNNNTIEGYPYYLTCEYSPPGNYLGEFAENVFEPNCIPFPAQPAGDIPGED